MVRHNRGPNLGYSRRRKISTADDDEPGGDGEGTLFLSMFCMYVSDCAVQLCCAETAVAAD